MRCFAIKSSNKFKNPKKINDTMKTEYIFYTVGIIFALAAVLYFTWEYLFSLARFVKIIVLLSLTSFFWFIGNWLRERGY